MRADQKPKKSKKKPTATGVGKVKAKAFKAKLDSIYHHSEDIVARMIEGELILVPLIAGLGNLENEIYALDETGKEIWNRMDGKKTTAEIIADLEKCYLCGAGTIGRDVLGLVNELLTRRFIIDSNSQ